MNTRAGALKSYKHTRKYKRGTSKAPVAVFGVASFARAHISEQKTIASNRNQTNGLENHWSRYKVQQAGPFLVT